MHTPLNLYQQQLCFFAEHILADTAQRTFEILGEILKFCSGSDSQFGSTCLLVVNPTAGVAYILFHSVFLLELFYRFKISGTVLAERADDILGEFVTFVDIAAYFADIALFAVCFWLGLDVIEIIAVGHCFGV